MLTAKQLNNRRVVLAKKTIQYFLLPQQFHYYHYYHHPNQGEHKSMFYKAFPFLQPLISGSIQRGGVHIPSDYNLQYKMPNTHQITAAEREGVAATPTTFIISGGRSVPRGMSRLERVGLSSSCLLSSDVVPAIPAPLYHHLGFYVNSNLMP